MFANEPGAEPLRGEPQAKGAKEEEEAAKQAAKQPKASAAKEEEEEAAASAATRHKREQRLAKKRRQREARRRCGKEEEKGEAAAAARRGRGEEESEAQEGEGVARLRQGEPPVRKRAPFARRVWDVSQPAFVCAEGGPDAPAGSASGEGAPTCGSAPDAARLMRGWSTHRALRDLHRLDGPTLAVSAAPSLRLLSEAFADLIEETLQTLSQASVYYRCARVAVVYAMARATQAAERRAYREAGEALQRLAHPALSAWAALAERGGSQQWSLGGTARLQARILEMGPGARKPALSEVREPEAEGFRAVVAVEPAEAYAAALRCPCSGVGFGVARAASSAARLHMLLVRLTAISFEVHRVGFLLASHGLDADGVADEAVGMLRSAGRDRDPGRLVHLDAATLRAPLPATRKEAYAMNAAEEAARAPALFSAPPAFRKIVMLFWEASVRVVPRVQRAFTASGADATPCAALAYRCIGDERAWVGDGEGGAGPEELQELPLWRLQRISAMERTFVALLSNRV